MRCALKNIRTTGKKRKNENDVEIFEALLRQDVAGTFHQVGRNAGRACSSLYIKSYFEKCRRLAGNTRHCILGRRHDLLRGFRLCLQHRCEPWMAARVARNFSEHVRHDLFERTLHLSAAQTDAFTIPSLESRITTDTYNVHSFVSMMQRMGVRAPILLVGGLSSRFSWTAILPWP